MSNSLTRDGVKIWLKQLDFERDVRRPPDTRRRGQFRAGWLNATKQGKEYTSDTMKRLTWHNLGYRMARHYGDLSSDQANRAFDYLSDLYVSSDPPTVAIEASQIKNKTVPSVQHYVEAFQSVSDQKPGMIRILQKHYSSPESVVTAGQLAHLLGMDSYQVINSLYGEIGRLVGEQLNFRPTQEKLGALVLFEHRKATKGYKKQWHWRMRSEVKEAIEALGWVDQIDCLQERDEVTIFPEEVSSTVKLFEGAVRTITVNAYERNPKARRECIECFGAKCRACGIDFEEKYGEVARGFIQVHHLRPLAKIGQEYAIDPITDLCPLCPNCHAVTHLSDPAYTIDEVKKFLKKATASSKVKPHP